MNFWEYKDDDSRGYWLPTSDKAARQQGNKFAHGFFYFINELFKLAVTIVLGLISLLFITIRFFIS